MDPSVSATQRSWHSHRGIQSLVRARTCA
jgi:hypothetical protein